MPCGGGDIGMNVWVENDDVLFYLSRSGSFDENNCLLKQGRFRVRLIPNPFAGTASFRQTLHLNDGYVSVSSDNATLIIWVDVFHPCLLYTSCICSIPQRIFRSFSGTDRKGTCIHIDQGMDSNIPLCA